MKFRNPTNDHVLEKSVPWLWALIFGGFYFLINACWAAMFVWFVLAILLFASMGPPAIVIMFIVNIVYAALAPSIVRNAYLRKGWIEKPEDSEDGSPATPTYKKCPFCAEMVRYEAIKCKHCGSELPAITPGTSVNPAEDTKKAQAAAILERYSDPSKLGFRCPNCETDLVGDEAKCYKCDATLNAHDGWRPISKSR